MPKQRKSDAPGGLVCPRCHCRHFIVTHAYYAAHHIRRRRVCRHCSRVVYTYEVTSADYQRRSHDVDNIN